MDDHPPVPGYELLELIGHNGHLIFKARQSATGKLVCLNIVHSGGDYGQMVAAGLRHRAGVLATLDHPNIVRLVETGGAPGYGFFSATEYVEGSALNVVFRLGELATHSEVIRIADQIAAALDYAHARNVLHGHLHPNHILLSRNSEILLHGFGEMVPNSPEGVILGNPHILAPEQFDGQEKTVPASDIYGLAEVVFLLLTGWYPFQGFEGIVELVKRKRMGPPPSIKERRPELPRRLDLVLQRAMAVRPEDRYPSARQFVEEMSQVLQEGDRKWWQFWG